MIYYNKYFKEGGGMPEDRGKIFSSTDGGTEEDADDDDPRESASITRQEPHIIIGTQHACIKKTDILTTGQSIAAQFIGPL